MARKSDPELLVAYDAHLTRFRAAPVLRDGILSNGGFAWRDDDPVLRTRATLEDSPFLAFCTYFRPLWLNDSPQSFHLIAGVLRRSSLTDKERAHLDRSCAHWKRNCENSYMYIGLGKAGEEPKTRTPADWITLILGETYHPHDNDARQEIIAHLTDVMGDQGWPFIQVYVLPNMTELTKAAFGLHEIVKNLRARP